MRVVVIGTGYVNLVSGACFVDIGHAATAADVVAIATEWDQIKQGELG
jgi:UDP-glucose 6-dehydrogenase